MSSTTMYGLNDSAHRRFLADAMLGRLARWLRVLGLDTSFNPAQEDQELVRLANIQGRALLTRDRHLINFLQPDQALLITKDAPLEQLRQVVRHYELPPPRELFTRCLRCNAELREIPAEEARERIPEDSRDLPGPVRQCPGCHRIYWAGSHTWRMRETLEHTLPGWLAR